MSAGAGHPAYRQLGTSGLTVSTVGMGCNSFGVTLPPDGVTEVVAAAIDAGITLFDTADVYGSTPGEGESLLGAALASRRDQVVVATKFGMDAGGLNGPDWRARGSRSYVRRAVEGSLTRLRTDHIDLYQLHAPDPLTPIEETLSALDDLVREGKVRYVGSSNLAGWQIVDADWVARSTGSARFVSAQNAYSLLSREAEREVLPAARHAGVGLLPYFPLASGLLTGKYRRGAPAPAGTRLVRRPERLAAADFNVIDALASLAAEWHIDLTTLAIGALAARPGVGSVIAGARTVEQVLANARAGQWVPSTTQQLAIDEAAPAARS